MKKEPVWHNVKQYIYIYIPSTQWSASMLFVHSKLIIDCFDLGFGIESVCIFVVVLSWFDQTATLWKRLCLLPYFLWIIWTGEVQTSLLISINTPDRRQSKTSTDFWSTFVGSINALDCRRCGQCCLVSPKYKTTTCYMANFDILDRLCGWAGWFQ